MAAVGVYGGECVENHSAFIFDRGGMRRIGPVVDLSSVKWERGRDNVTSATIRIEGDACAEQAAFVAAIRSHRHELVIYRGKDRVWEGPVHRVTSYGSYTEINARDVSEYLFHTPLTQAYDNRYPNTGIVTTRIGNIIDYELTHGRSMVDATGATVAIPAWESLDPPLNVAPYVVIHHWPNEAQTSAYTMPYEMTVGAHLTNLARQSGIDWTVVGRAIHVWDVSRSLGRVGQLTEANFLDDVIVSEYGADHAQAAYVIGQDGVYGGIVNPAYLDYYGPWTDITTAFNEEGTTNPTAGELRSQASRNIAGRVPVPIEVRVPDNSGLVLDESLTINDLVPGVQVPLRARINARPLAQMQKIDHVVVSETSSGETVQVTLTPTTRADSDVEPETP